MRVYHFVNAAHGLEDIRRRRLKVATLHELNDPFELFGVKFRDEKLRPMFRKLKDRTAARMGLLCFSRDWHNPVLWSHYADRHAGLCLGFDVEDNRLFHINYSRRRAVLTPEDFGRNTRDMASLMKRMFTKYTHWRYESESRMFVNLAETQIENGLRFADFRDVLQLKEVIVGAQSEVTRQQLREALGEFGATVKAFKARLAFNTFRVVRQRREDFWL